MRVRSERCAARCHRFTKSTTHRMREEVYGPLPIDLNRSDLEKILNAELAEGKRFGAFDLEDPELDVATRLSISSLPLLDALEGSSGVTQQPNVARTHPTLPSSGLGDALRG